MRNYYATSITLLLLCISIQTMSQPLKKVESYYDPYTRTRIHEAYTTLSTPPYVKHGAYKEWDQSGVLMTEASFQNGKKHGPFKVFINAGMADIYGKENVGKVYSMSNYSNDELNGLEQMFDYAFKKQQLILRKNWVNGQQTKEESWYENGKTKSLTVMNGVCTAWYPNGNKMNEVTRKDGVEDGKINEWYESGKLAFTGTFQNGKQVGESVVYFENGSVRKKIKFDPTTYKDINTIEYYPGGKVKWESVSVDGQHYMVTSYDSLRGYKRMVQERISNQNQDDGSLILHGKSTEYNDDGSIIEEVTYEHGNANGQVQTVDKDGKIVLQGEFQRGTKVGEWLYYLKEDGTKTNKMEEALFYRKISYGKNPFRYTDYYVTGEKMAEGFLRQEWPDQNVQFIKKYYKNGQVSEQGLFNYNTYRNVYDGKDGEWKYFFENGNLKVKGSFRLNEQFGVWEYYDEQGDITESKRF